jgi:uncharacterized protein (TIGR03437 family)
MKRTFRLRLAILVLAFAFPAAVLADLNQTSTLSLGNTLNLDTGAVANSGGDIQFSASGITPQGSAKTVNFPLPQSADGFAILSLLEVSLWSGYSTATIPISTLESTALGPPFADAFFAHTNGGHYAKVLVTASTSSTITLTFTTFGVAAGSGGGTSGPPAITQILNNSSGTPKGLPNYGIAPSSIFVVTGTGLADPGDPVLQSTAAPGLPLMLNGASLTVVVNNVTTHPALYYTSPTQIAAVLPAATPVGTGTLTLTYNGVNATATILVVTSAVGVNHFNQIAIPLGKFNENIDIGVATDAFTGALLTFTNSGTPGQIITLWTTGLGADPADSDTTYTLTPHSVNTPLQIYIGGVLAAVSYQGSAGYPGVDQINLTIPASVPTGCYVPLVAVTGTVVSNVVTLPIQQGGATCVEPQTGGLTITGDQILKNTQDTLKGGVLTLLQTNGTNASGTRTVTSIADAAFAKISGLLAGATGRGGIISPGGCWVAPTIAGGPLTVAGLDAGGVNLTGPAGLDVSLPPQLGIKGVFGATLAGGVIPSSGGTFTFKGLGGADVGPFTSTVILSNPLLTWTNQSSAAIVDRTQGLMVTWTGGNPGTFVIITGSSTASGVIAGYGCRIAVEAGQFTVPSYILLGLPAGSGGASIQNSVNSTFSATGLDNTSVSGGISYSVTSTYK